MVVNRDPKAEKRVRDRKRRRDWRNSSPETKEYGKILRKDPCAFPGCKSPGVTKDHIVAFSKGGRTHWTNLAPLCLRHNQMKGNMDLLQFLLKARMV